MSQPSISSQIAAVQAVIAIAFDGKPKPKGEQGVFLREQAKAAIDTLRAIAARTGQQGLDTM
jgi:hypothetical protein